MSKDWSILIGNAEDKLKELADNSIQCCITSPPYYGLRDYGSGTTGAVALRYRRKYIGIDLNEDYVGLAVDRLNNVSAEMSKTRLW